MTIEDLKRAFVVSLGVFMIILLIIGGIMIILFMGDQLTVEQTGTVRVKCIDDVGARFVDEMCDKKVYCSSLGIAANKRCGK